MDTGLLGECGEDNEGTYMGLSSISLSPRGLRAHLIEVSSEHATASLRASKLALETSLLKKVAGSPGWALQGPPPQEPRALRTQLRGETRGPLTLLLLEPKSFSQQPCYLQTYSFVNAQLIPKRSGQTLKTPYPSFPEVPQVFIRQ